MKLRNRIMGCAYTSNMKNIQRNQNKILRAMVNAPGYVTNETIHRDLKI